MASRFDRRLGLAIALLLPLISSTASGQAWLEDRRRTEGRGIRLGDLELHPGLGVEAGYDTNVFYADKDPVGSAILRVTPHLTLSTLTQERTQDAGGNTAQQRPAAIQFRGGLSASFYHFFVDKARDSVDGDLTLSLTINPNRPFSVNLFERFGRTIRPFGQNLTGGSLNYGRDQNQVGARFTLSSHGGVLSANMGYTFGYDYFEGADFAFARSLTHTIEGGASWRFLPQTAILYDVRLEFQEYTNAETSLALVTNNTRIRSRIGLNGAFTQRFAMSALIGYSAGFYADSRSDEFESVAAQLEARWTPSQTVKLAIGYEREFAPSFIGNYYRRDQIYTDLQLMLGGTFLFGAKVTGGLLGFGSVIDRTGMMLGTTLERNDIRLTASLYGEYRVANWLGFTGTLAYTGDFTDFTYQAPTAMGSVLVPAGYNKLEAWLGVRAFY